MPKRLVHRDALHDLAYPYDDEEDFFLLRIALEKDQIDEVIKISEMYKAGGQCNPAPCKFHLLTIQQTKKQSTAMKRSWTRHRLRHKNLDTKSSSERSTSTHLQTSPRPPPNLDTPATSHVTNHVTRPRAHAVHLPQASHPLAADTCLHHAVKSATVPAVAVPPKPSSKSARR